MIDGYDLQLGDSTFPFLFDLVGEDGFTPLLGATATVLLSKAGGGFGAPAGAVGEVGYGVYGVAADADDRDTLGPAILYVTAPGALPRKFCYRIVAYDPFDAAALGLTNLDAAISGLPTAGQLADAVWDEAASGHVGVGTMGKALADILQVEQGKWKVDKGANTLTFYASDDVTPLFVFDLLDDAAESSRTPS